MSRLRSLAASLVALPYRFRFGRLGSRPRILPPLLISGPASAIEVGDETRIESFASLSVGGGGRLKIGSRCELRSFARLEADEGTIEIGDDSSVNPFSLLSGYGTLVVGSNVRIASHCVILSSTHGHYDAATTIREQGVERRATVIEDDVWIGAHAVVIGGVRIGAHSVVGAGAVVIEDVAPYSVVGGVPAKLIRTRAG